jgi:hypothetical protein
MSPLEAHQSVPVMSSPATGAALVSRDLPAVPTVDPSWLLIEEGFSLAREHEVESRFTVANGYVGTRGSLDEGTSLSAPATYLAGVFDIGADWVDIPELALAPDWRATSCRWKPAKRWITGASSICARELSGANGGIAIRTGE